MKKAKVQKAKEVLVYAILFSFGSFFIFISASVLLGDNPEAGEVTGKMTRIGVWAKEGKYGMTLNHLELEIQGPSLRFIYFRASQTYDDLFQAIPKGSDLTIKFDQPIKGTNRADIIELKIGDRYS